MIKLIVSGDSEGLYTILGKEAFKIKLQDVDCLEVVDDNNMILYIVPLTEVIYMEITKEQEKAKKEYANLNASSPINITITIKTSEKDLAVVGDKYDCEYFNTTPYGQLNGIINVYKVNEKKTYDKSFLTPLKNLRYIEFSNK